ncbi:hypothetical protein [Streptomyces xinghaiensis]|uniref:hypothetical protein n=1 Tax=Streptomyces xinghaiensis TaxID=1038928 RepID=UPI000317DBB3|nr:hypothetical protein [Streptomyces xinghaiensis]MZE81411.1 hypothetical protein [Streptomyces sp. SID5475]
MEKIANTRVQQFQPHYRPQGGEALPHGGGQAVAGAMKAALALGGAAAVLWVIFMVYTLTLWTLGG